MCRHCHHRTLATAQAPPPQGKCGPMTAPGSAAPAAHAGEQGHGLLNSTSRWIPIRLCLKETQPGRLPLHTDLFSFLRGSHCEVPASLRLTGSPAPSSLCWAKGYLSLFVVALRTELRALGIYKARLLPPTGVPDPHANSASLSGQSQESVLFSASPQQSGP